MLLLPPICARRRLGSQCHTQRCCLLSSPSLKAFSLLNIDPDVGYERPQPNGCLMHLKEHQSQLQALHLYVPRRDASPPPVSSPEQTPQPGGVCISLARPTDISLCRRGPYIHRVPNTFFQTAPSWALHRNTVGSGLVQTGDWLISVGRVCQHNWETP